MPQTLGGHPFRLWHLAGMRETKVIAITDATGAESMHRLTQAQVPMLPASAPGLDAGHRAVVADSGPPRADQLSSVHDRHLAAVARSLGWAQESAARGDYADALGWVRAVEAIGDVIPDDYQTMRRAWLSALGESRRDTASV